MGKTSIEWTDMSVNPIRFGKGHYCQKISPGCANCYASRFQPRVGNPTFGGVSSAKPLPILNVKSSDKDLWLDQSKLSDVLMRRRPTKWFWCDMTDLFGDWVPNEFIDECFAVMFLTKQHTHQVLTKRPERAKAYLSGEYLHQRLHERIKHRMGYDHPKRPAVNRADLPMPNVWIGTSVEDQQRADERIPHLLNTPAAVRFLSVEPLLGPISFTDGPLHPEESTMGEWSVLNLGIHWVIVGGESGPGARSCQTNWIRSIVEQCQAAGVACFVKQLGSRPICQSEFDTAAFRATMKDRKGGDLSEFPVDLRVREFPTALVH